MWTCGWWVSADPQVCSTDVTPIRAPRCLGSAAIVMRSLGGSFEQQVVDHGLVLIGDLADRRRQGEDHVVIGDRQQLGLAFGQPSLRRRALALGAMPIATAVVRDRFASAVLAARDMPAEGRRATALDRRHHFQLVETDMAGVGLAPHRSMVAEDIRDLQSRTSHDRSALTWAAWRLPFSATSDDPAGS